MERISQTDLEEIISQHEKWRRSNYQNGNRAILSNIDLTGAMIIARDLSGADLSSTILNRANLRRTILDGARLDNTSFREANLYRVNFNHAKVHNTDVTAAISSFTIYTGMNLCGFKNLHKMEHQAPSSVGINTLEITKFYLYKQYKKAIHQQIEMFLKQCGIKENFLSFLSDAFQERTKFYNAFISYSSRDKSFSKKLYYALQKANVRCWYAPEELEIGDLFEYKINGAIRKYDKTILICSKNSLTSHWVEKEIARALRKKELSNRNNHKVNILLPVLLDNYIFNWNNPYQEEILQRLHYDFFGWEDNETTFNTGIRKLLKALEK